MTINQTYTLTHSIPFVVIPTTASLEITPTNDSPVIAITIGVGGTLTYTPFKPDVGGVYRFDWLSNPNTINQETHTEYRFVGYSNIISLAEQFSGSSIDELLAGDLMRGIFLSIYARYPCIKENCCGRGYSDISEGDREAFDYALAHYLSVAVKSLPKNAAGSQTIIERQWGDETIRYSSNTSNKVSTDPSIEGDRYMAMLECVKKTNSTMVAFPYAIGGSQYASRCDYYSRRY